MCPRLDWRCRPHHEHQHVKALPQALPLHRQLRSGAPKADAKSRHRHLDFAGLRAQQIQGLRCGRGHEVRAPKSRPDLTADLLPKQYPALICAARPDCDYLDSQRPHQSSRRQRAHALALLLLKARALCAGAREQARRSDHELYQRLCPRWLYLRTRPRHVDLIRRRLRGDVDPLKLDSPQPGALPSSSHGVKAAQRGRPQQARVYRRLR